MADSCPRGDWALLVVPVRRELSRDQTRLAYLLIYSVKSCSALRGADRLFRPSVMEIVFGRSEKFSDFRANFRAARSVKHVVTNTTNRPFLGLAHGDSRIGPSAPEPETLCGPSFDGIFQYVPPGAPLGHGRNNRVLRGFPFLFF